MMDLDSVQGSAASTPSWPCQEQRKFPTNTASLVTVQWVDSCDSLWVLMHGEIEIIENVSQILSECDDHAVNHVGLTSVAINDVVAALFPDDECWYRAKVLRTEPIVVQFIDYGNVCQVTQVAPLPPKLKTLHPLAIHVLLASKLDASPQIGNQLLVNYISSENGIAQVSATALSETLITKADSGASNSSPNSNQTLDCAEVTSLEPMTLQTSFESRSNSDETLSEANCVSSDTEVLPAETISVPPEEVLTESTFSASRDNAPEFSTGALKVEIMSSAESAGGLSLVHSEAIAIAQPLETTHTFGPVEAVLSSNPSAPSQPGCSMDANEQISAAVFDVPRVGTSEPESNIAETVLSKLSQDETCAELIGRAPDASRESFSELKAVTSELLDVDSTPPPRDIGLQDEPTAITKPVNLTSSSESRNLTPTLPQENVHEPDLRIQANAHISALEGELVINIPPNMSEERTTTTSVGSTDDLLGTSDVCDSPVPLSIPKEVLAEKVSDASIENTSHVPKVEDLPKDSMDNNHLSVGIISQADPSTAAAHISERESDSLTDLLAYFEFTKRVSISEDNDVSTETGVLASETLCAIPRLPALVTDLALSVPKDGTSELNTGGQKTQDMSSPMPTKSPDENTLLLGHVTKHGSEVRNFEAAPVVEPENSGKCSYPEMKQPVFNMESTKEISEVQKVSVLDASKGCTKTISDLCNDGSAEILSDVSRNTASEKLSALSMTNLSREVHHAAGEESTSTISDSQSDGSDSKASRNVTPATIPDVLRNDSIGTVSGASMTLDVKPSAMLTVSQSDSGLKATAKVFSMASGTTPVTSTIPKGRTPRPLFYDIMKKKIEPLNDSRLHPQMSEKSEYSKCMDFELGIIREQSRIQMLEFQKKMEQELAYQINVIKQETSRQMSTVGHKLANILADIALLKNDVQMARYSQSNASSSCGLPIMNSIPYQNPNPFSNMQHFNHEATGRPNNVFQYESDFNHPMNMQTSSFNQQQQPPSKKDSHDPSTNASQKTKEQKDIKSSSKCVFVRNLPEKATLDNLFNLFGVYGNIHKIKMVRPKKAIIEMSDKDQATMAIRYLNNISLMGSKLHVAADKHQSIMMSSEDAEANIAKDFNTKYLQRIQRFTQGSWDANKLEAPTNKLILHNIHKDVSDDQIKEAFKKEGGFDVRIRLLRPRGSDDRKMGFITCDSTEEAVNVLTVMHLFELTDWMKLRIGFCKN